MLMRAGAIVRTTGPKENLRVQLPTLCFDPQRVWSARKGRVLTGKLDDGAAGLKAIEACGAFTIVQEPSSCVASDMPKAALRAVSPNVVVPIDGMAAAIVSALTTIRIKDSIWTAESALPRRRRSR
ncbi:Protein-glutamate methylesterase/protein-glutamine glutaminase [Paraburkholderia kirstenboschensis]|nr:Protein-glutamate methylesterase/protein-glutamine glutaminase [Paraburkholderia kirstenboschensis]